MPHCFKPNQPRWWQWLTVLSLDAPLVAVLWQALFAQVADVKLPWHDPLLLGLAVWIVYAADRWIEGWRLSPEIVQTPRHLFYINHRWPVFWIGVVAIIATTVIAVAFLDGREFKAGFILLIPTLIYLFSHQLLHRHHPLRLPKELCIAVIFTLGCALSATVQAPGSLSALWLPALLFCLLCLANCALISVWEHEVDARHGQTSLALQLKERAGFIHLLPWLIAAGALIALLMGDPRGRLAAGCALASGVLLGLLDLAHPRLGRLRSRAAIDLTLMTPVIVLFLR